MRYLSDTHLLDAKGYYAGVDSAITPSIALPPASLQSADPRFVAGVKYLKAKNFSAALSLFAAADVGNSEDSFSNLYTVFHGLTRLYLGDERGLSLCRRAAYFESYIAEVHYRHALGELKMRKRYKGVCAVKAGLAIDPKHRALCQLREDLGVRQGPALAFLSRDHVLNRLLGRLQRRARDVGTISGR